MIKMFKNTDKFLITYDPQYFEGHTDSSDFEDSMISDIEAKGGNHCLISKAIARKLISKEEKNILNNKIKNPGGQKNYHINQLDLEETSQLKNKGRNNIDATCYHGSKEGKMLHLNHGDYVETEPKKSLLRHKLIPCLSSIFGRSCYKMVPTKEKVVMNVHKDNSCQVQRTNCERQRNRKYIKEHTYTVSPVYALQSIHETPFNATKTTQTSLYHRKRQMSIKQYSNTSCTVSMSSEDDFEDVNKEKAREHKFRKRVKLEMTKQYLNYQAGRCKKHQEQQYPSKQGPYQVFTTPYQQQARTTNISPDSGSPYRGSAQSTSSSFWEYLFDKINRKYQTHRLEVSKPCYCSKTSNKYEVQPNSEPTYCCKTQKTIPEENSCSCSGNSDATVSNDSSSKCCPEIKATEGLTLTVPPAEAPKKKGPPTLNKKIQCKCYTDKENQKPLTSSKPASLPSPRQQNYSGKSCQAPHDEIVQSIADKYNGEILCIHNPPCVLINGCLNLPSAKGAPSLNIWPVLQDGKTSFNQLFKRTSPKPNNKIEQSCQYHVPSVEVRQCQTPEYKTEKMIQSICDHKPPCEIVRCCNKYRYDPKLKNSCVHVPMCQKIPECKMGIKHRNAIMEQCDHKPKCIEVPMCTRDYVLLTARDSVGTQVKPQTKMVCRHVPPCIMIPKCLGKALRESYISNEAIPGCMHQPACEMIPACCRKSTKEMVSVCSQYPNGCRVV